MAGKQSFESSTAATLDAIGITDTVAHTEQEYIEIAVRLANAPQALAQHRATVRARMQGSCLMDYDGFVAEMEAAYRLMWLNHLHGDKRYLSTRQDVPAAIAYSEQSRAAPGTVALAA